MRLLKWFFMSKYKKLLYSILCAQNNEQRLHLENGIVLDFRPGHEYDASHLSVVPSEEDDDFFLKYSSLIEQVTHIDVYDCFSGEVLIKAVGRDRIFVEIVYVEPCYRCQSTPSPGSKYWIGSWEICDKSMETPIYKDSVFGEEDLPF